MILDVSSYPVITDMPSRVIDQWLNDNIGPLISADAGELGCDSWGTGWRLYWHTSEDYGVCGKWLLDVDDESKITLFLLRWS